MPSANRQDFGKLIIRVTLGFLVLLHGIHKLSHGVSQIEQMLQGAGFPAFLAYAVYLGEVLGPLLLILGYYSRIGAGLVAINMMVAIALVHQGELFQLTQQGGWMLELQGMYLFTAIGLFFTGAGRIAFRSRWN